MKVTSFFRTSFNFMKTFYRFSAEQTATPTTTEPLKEKVVVTPEENNVHLKPYNKDKYEVPSSKIKYATGYALLDIEPMPRARIMKLCYILMDRLKEIPEDAMFRIYSEEKFKYIMRHTDETEDIRTLEETFGHESIEIFIQCLHNELQLIEHMKVVQPWVARDQNTELHKFIKTHRIPLKHEKQTRPEREKVQFIDAKK